MTRGTEYNWAPGFEVAENDLADQYERGLVGCLAEPEEDERLDEVIRDGGGDPNGGDVATSYGFHGMGDGELILPYLHVTKAYPNCWPGKAQQVGDCTSQSTRSACLLSLVCEVASRTLDEISGKLEQLPDPPPSQRAIGSTVMASESAYWWRGRSGHGWSSSAAARVILTKSGAVLRRDYPGHFDLSEYSGKAASRYGADPPPASWVEISNDHLFRTATRCSVDEMPAFLAKGFGISSDGSEGFARSVGADLTARRSGSWAHALAIIGADLRGREPLFLIQNSWGNYLKYEAGRKIPGTNYEIPRGSFFARASDIRNRRNICLSAANGWQRNAIDLTPGFK